MSFTANQEKICAIIFTFFLFTFSLLMHDIHLVDGPGGKRFLGQEISCTLSVLLVFIVVSVLFSHLFFFRPLSRVCLLE